MIKSMLDVNDGLADRLFAEALEKVNANLSDKRMDPTASRKVIIEFEFKPDKNGPADPMVIVRAKTKLAPPQGFARVHLYTDIDGEIQMTEPAADQTVLDFSKGRKTGR